MKLLIAIHGIMCGESDASWPDYFDGFMAKRDQYHSWRLIKKEYRMLPFPRLNVWFRDPHIARGIVAEILIYKKSLGYLPKIWFVTHSNGAMIARICIKLLLKRGIDVAGVIFVAGAIDADVHESGVFDFVYPSGAPASGTAPDSNLPCRRPALHQALAWSSRGDGVLNLPLIWPYGRLGRDGFNNGAGEFNTAEIYTCWFPDSWGHSAYWDTPNQQASFEKLYQTITA